MSVLELNDVWKARGAGARAILAVRAVSLAVAPGEIVLVEGPSGSGKTTLLTLGAGLLTADRGTVVLAGAALGSLGGEERRGLRARAAGFVFQRSNLLPAITVRDNVLLAADLAGIPRAVSVARADQLLEQLGLTAAASRRPDTLSGGEEQRVAVARALVHRPAVLFADEPTGNLDGAAGRAVAEALSTLAREAGAGVLIATHDARLRPFATRHLHMSDGQLSPAGGA